MLRIIRDIYAEFVDNETRILGSNHTIQKLIDTSSYTHKHIHHSVRLYRTYRGEINLYFSLSWYKWTFRTLPCTFIRLKLEIWHLCFGVCLFIWVFDHNSWTPWLICFKLDWGTRKNLRNSFSLVKNSIFSVFYEESLVSSLLVKLGSH